MIITRTAVAALLLAFALPAFADEAQDTFNSLYGADLKRVLATPTPADDIALARQLIDAAKAVANQPALLAVLCDKAYELGAKDPSGHAVAMEAMNLLIEKSPERKVDCLQKCVVLYQRQYAALGARPDAKAKAGEALVGAMTGLAQTQIANGDVDGAVAVMRQAFSVASAVGSPAKAAIQAELATAITRQIFAKQLVALKEKVAANAGDTVSRKELVRLYLVEFDNPAEAAKYVDASLDLPMCKYVPAAAKPIEDVPELACLELATWFHDLAGQANTPSGKATVLQQARRYYERYLELHTAGDMSQAVAKLALAKVTEALDALGPAGKRPAAAPPWTDCLKQFDLSKAASGNWERKDGGLVATAEERRSATIALPFTATGSYQFRFTAVRVTGNERCSISLPLVGAICRLTFSATDGRMYTFVPQEGAQPPRQRLLELAVKPPTPVAAGQSTTFDFQAVVSGDKAFLTVNQDNKPYLAWSGATSTFAPVASGFGPRMYVSSGSMIFQRMEFRLLPEGTKPPAAATSGPTAASK